MSDSFRLLIAYDGSPCGDEAIEDLQRAGLPDTVEALVLSVADLWILPQDQSAAPPPLRPPAVIRQARASAAAMLEAAARSAERGAALVQRQFPHWTVCSETAAESPAWAITLKAEVWGADLIIVGSRGYSQLERWVLGSVSNAVLTHATSSVRVARSRPTLPARPLRIMVGVDGSSEAEMAVKVVAGRVWPAGTDIRLIMVLNPSFLEEITSSAQASDAAPPTVSGTSEDEGEAVELDGMLHRMLDGYAAEIAKNPSAPTYTTSLASGDPRKVLVEMAQDWGADCIFIGSRGLNRWERLLLGSVSQAVAERAHCPVEVVRRLPG